MSNALSKDFNFLSLMKFTLPTMVMMVFMSLYVMVDAVFVSRFIGTTALSAVNIVYPLVSVIVAIAIMLATGGSAVIAIKMGEGKDLEAKQDFTLIVLVGIGVGCVIALLEIIFMKPLIYALGANDAIYQYCSDYALILAFCTPLSILQLLFQYFFVTTGKPHIGLTLTLMGGCANIILDYVFIVPMNMGISGAALATGIGYSIPAIFGLLYFIFNKKSTLHFVKPKMNKQTIIDSCLNGSSEMVTNMSMAIITFLFNIIMIKYLGENGVAAITIVLYSQYLLTSIYTGFSSGIAPLISYNYGNDNFNQVKKLFKMSMIFIVVCSILTAIFSIMLSSNIIHIFAPRGSEVFDIAQNGYILFAISYLFIGFNIFASAMFTALSDGKVSAIISFLHTFLFIIVSILILPPVLGINGVWLAVPLAEAMSIIVSIIYIYKLRGKYQYI